MEPLYPWAKFPSNYRQREIQVLTRWIAAAQNGVVVGLPGCGRSNLLGFLTGRPDVIQTYLPATPEVTQIWLVPVDLHNLPATDLATFYRVLLRAFYHSRESLDLKLQEEIIQLYQANADKQDPFLSQSALYELLFLLQHRRIRTVLVFNYFDDFLEEATPPMFKTLWGLRDNFRYWLCFLAGMKQEMAYYPEPERLGELYDLLGRNVCWIGALNDSDALAWIVRATPKKAQALTPTEGKALLNWSGNFPSLLEQLLQWAFQEEARPPLRHWENALKQQSLLRYRLARIWLGLTQEEQFVLSELQRLQEEPEIVGKKKEIPPLQKFIQQHLGLLKQLERKGVCKPEGKNWQIQGEMLKSYVKEMGPSSRGLIGLNEETQEIYQGSTILKDLPPLEQKLLRYFLANPRRPHAKDHLIDYLWGDKAHEMNDNDLQQLVYRLRKRIDTDPPHYIVTLKGPIAGYKFFPEGLPR